MDTGEFVALDTPYDRMREIANNNRHRAEELAEALLDIAKRSHNSFHVAGHKAFEYCQYHTCRRVRTVLGI